MVFVAPPIPRHARLFELIRQDALARAAAARRPGTPVPLDYGRFCAQASATLRRVAAP